MVQHLGACLISFENDAARSRMRSVFALRRVALNSTITPARSTSAPVRWTAKCNGVCEVKPRRDVSRSFAGASTERLMKVPIRLESHPKLRRSLEKSRETERGISRDATLPENDFIEAIQRDPQT